MADILKVTTPPTGYENNTRTNPITVGDQTIQNIVDPSKVVRPDGKPGSMADQNGEYLLNFESNFETFMKSVKDAGGLSEIFTELIFSKMGVMVSSGVGENFAEEIAQFMEMLKMNPEQLQQFLKNQSSSAVRFKGAFFDVLRQVLSNTTSTDMKTDVLDFLKRYNDMTSSKHIMGSIMQNLKDIARSIPNSYRQGLMELAQKLDQNPKDGDTAPNAAIMKEEIIPYLSKYVSRTYDMGPARDLITLLTLNIARFENGNKEAFEQSFLQLMGYRAVRDKLGGLDTFQLEAVLRNTEFAKAAEQADVIDQLVSIIRQGLSGKGGLETKAVFQEIINALLVNESVYMPLLHMMIPAELNGNLMFSEMWIDPDDQQEKAGGSQERSIRLFIKFDIKDVGYFEMVLVTTGSKMDLQLYYPPSLAAAERQIKTGIATIMANNGYDFKNFVLERVKRPKSISEVFPKIYERKNTINVRI